jgi:hypothetical protein
MTIPPPSKPTRAAIEGLAERAAAATRRDPEIDTLVYAAMNDRLLPDRHD